MCDQLIALLSPEVSASIVWNDEESDTESIDIDVSDEGRLFKFEITEASLQEEGAVSRPGFQVTLNT